MRREPAHLAKVVGTPLPGVFCTFAESARHYGRHWHATYGVGMLVDGAQRSASGRGQVDAFAGDLITTNPGEVHDGQPLDGPSRRWQMVYLEPAAMAGMAADSRSPAAIALTRPVFRDEALRDALRRLFADVGAWSVQPSATHALACEESLARACGELLARHATDSAAPAIGGDIARVRERLADDPLDTPTLAELAAIAGLSRYQVLRRFEKAVGMPPHAWLLHHRAERARGLIRAGASLADAACASGFADQSHMTRTFVRHFGFTPGAWRAAACNSVQDRR